jgi:nitrite reductase/ring-hydroxylating ferredoxin subunit
MLFRYKGFSCRAPLETKPAARDHGGNKLGTTDMKSAYGRTLPPPAIDLTHVEAGSPMGELLRRYWQPVCLSEELKDLPKKVKILCEEVVLFRTKSGQVGCLEPHCSHRGSSLEFGRVERDGLRCCYHGWLYAPDGRVTEMPCEKPGVCERMNIEHPTYPVREFGGLVFVYMGPPGTEPTLPVFDVLDTSRRTDVVLRGMRLWDDYAIGFVRDCNWLQHFENVVDPWHVFVLHQSISGDQFDSAMMTGSGQVAFEQTSLGVRYKVTKSLPNGNRLVRYCEAVVPNIALIPSIHEKGIQPVNEDRCSDVTWVVPVDNEHVTGLTIVAWPLENGEPKKDWRPGTDTVSDIRPGSYGQRTYEDKQRRPDDLEAQESQRTIAIHGLEHLAGSDVGIVRLRKLLSEQVKKVAAGMDPMNIFRAPTEGGITTNAWNTVVRERELVDH